MQEHMFRAKCWNFSRERELTEEGGESQIEEHAIRKMREDKSSVESEESLC